MPSAPSLKPITPGRRALAGAALGLAIAGGLSLARPLDAIEGVERRFVDTRTREYLGQSKPDPRIVIAEVRESDVDAIKESTEGTVGWPWPLEYNVMAFEWLAHCGVEAVLVDVYQFDRGAGEGEVGGDEASADTRDAGRLADVWRRMGRVSLAFELTRSRPEKKEPKPLRQDAFSDHIRRLPAIDVEPAYGYPYAHFPVVRLMRGANRMGYANADTDDDGIMRRTSPVARLDWGGTDVEVPSLPLAAAIDLSPPPGTIDGRVVRLRDSVQRLSEDGSFIVNFRGPNDTYPYVSPSLLVEAGGALLEQGSAYAGPPIATARPEFLKGKIVVWGVNIAGIKDIVPTPVSDQFNGPEFQATILDNLLHGDGRVLASPGLNAVVLLVLGLVLGVVGAYTSRRGASIGTAALLGALLYFGGYRLFAAGTVIDLFTPALCILLTYAGTTAFRLMTEGRRNRWLEGTFAQYLSPAVIEELKKQPDRLALGGRQTEITVFFSDIKGFTSLSEALGAENTVKLLNPYLTGQSRPVLNEKGVIDKFIGDAVMAFFGDPLPMGDHAIRACRAAVRCRKALADLEPLAKQLGVPPVINRIGINSGTAIVGNMGSEDRFDYTAMGNTVNLASRLEGANKAFRSWILLGPLTYEQAKDAIVAKPIARIQVMGKQEAVEVHELLAMKEDAPADVVRHAEAFTRAHRLLLADDLPGTFEALREAEAARPDDGPTEWLRSLAEQLREGGLERPWNGVVVLESK